MINVIESCITHSIGTEINDLERPLRTLLKFVQNMHPSEPTMKFVDYFVVRGQIADVL